MTNRMKWMTGVGLFLLSSVEQTLCSLYGRFFEEPLDPVVLLGIAGLVYAIQKYKFPEMEVSNKSLFVKLIVGCLLFSIASIVFSKGAFYLLTPNEMTLTETAILAVVKSCASLGWCLATIAALLALRDVFTMK